MRQAKPLIMADTSPSPIEQARPGQERPVFELFTSRGFEPWLKSCKASIVLTTYQVGKIFFLGLKPDGKLWVFNRDIGRCLDIAASGPDLWIAGGTQIYRFRDAMADEQRKPADG